MRELDENLEVFETGLQKLGVSEWTRFFWEKHPICRNVIHMKHFSGYSKFFGIFLPFFHIIYQFSNLRFALVKFSELFLTLQGSGLKLYDFSKNVLKSEFSPFFPKNAIFILFLAIMKREGSNLLSFFQYWTTGLTARAVKFLFQPCTILFFIDCLPNTNALCWMVPILPAIICYWFRVDGPCSHCLQNSLAKMTISLLKLPFIPLQLILLNANLAEL